MRCMTCGAESEPNAKFCEMCGAPLPQPTGQAAGQVTGPGAGSVTGQVTGQPIGQAAGQATDPTAGQPAGQPAGQVPGQAAGKPYGQPAAIGQQPQQWQQTYSAQPDAAYQAAPYAPNPTPQPAQGKQASGAPFVLAIIALVTALLGLFPVSLVLAIIALAMNSGQKKRGETSTKQTPTFVMGLISLIISILMVVATLLLGGAVWLALTDEDLDLDLDHVVTSTAPSQAATGESPAGVWSVVSLTGDGETYDEEYLKLMNNMGVSFQLVIAEDGTASLEFFDESETGTWQDRGSGKVAITFDGDTVVGTVTGDELTISYDGDDLVLRRMSESTTATEAASSSGSASSSASA